MANKGMPGDYPPGKGGGKRLSPMEEELAAALGRGENEPVQAPQVPVTGNTGEKKTNPARQRGTKSGSTSRGVTVRRSVPKPAADAPQTETTSPTQGERSRIQRLINEKNRDLKKLGRFDAGAIPRSFSNAILEANKTVWAALELYEQENDPTLKNTAKEMYEEALVAYAAAQDAYTAEAKRVIEARTTTTAPQEGKDSGAVQPEAGPLLDKFKKNWLEKLRAVPPSEELREPVLAMWEAWDNAHDALEARAAAATDEERALRTSEFNARFQELEACNRVLSQKYQGVLGEQQVLAADSLGAPEAEAEDEFDPEANHELLDTFRSDWLDQLKSAPQDEDLRTEVMAMWGARDKAQSILSEYQAAATDEERAQLQEEYAAALEELKAQDEVVYQKYQELMKDHQPHESDALDTPEPEPDPIDAVDTPEPRRAQNMDEYLEMTRGEKLKKLSEKLEGFRESGRVPTAHELYEQRADNLANRLGLTAERSALLAAKNLYFQVRKRQLMDMGDSVDVNGPRMRYEAALFAWRSKLAGVSETLTGDDKIEALIVRKRDTILGPTSLETEIKKAALDERGKTLVGKIDNWINAVPVYALKAANLPVVGLAAGMAWVHDKLRGPDTASKLSREDLARNYARGVRIVGGASIATFLAISASPVVASVPLLTFMIYLARARLGIAVATGAGYLAGEGYSRYIAAGTREDLATGVKGRDAGIEEYKKLLKKFKRGNARQRAKHKAMLEMGAVLVAGGATGALSSAAAHSLLESFGSLPSVQHASDAAGQGRAALAVDTKPPAAVAPAEAPAAAAAPASAAPTPMTPEQVIAQAAADAGKPFPDSFGSSEPWGTAIDKSGEGASQLFVDMRQHYAALYPDPSTAPPAIRHVLEAKSADALSREFGFIDEANKSLVVQKGATLSVDDHGRLLFRSVGTDPASEQALIKVTPRGEVEVREIEGGKFMGARVVDTGPEVRSSETVAATTEENIYSRVIENPDPSTLQHAPSGVVLDSVPEDIATTSAETGSGVMSADQATSQLEGRSPASSVVVSDSTPDTTKGVMSADQAISELERGIQNVIVNSYGTEVNVMEPTAYTWKFPGTDTQYAVAYGGPRDGLGVWAERYLTEHPKESVVLFSTPVRDSLTGVVTERIDAWSRTSSGALELVRGIVDQNGRGFPQITTDGFISKRM